MHHNKNHAHTSHTAAVSSITVSHHSFFLPIFNGRDMKQLICQGTIHLCISEISEQADCHSHQGSVMLTLDKN